MIGAVCSLAALAFIGIAAYKFSQSEVSYPNTNVGSASNTSSDVPSSSVTVLNSNGTSSVNPLLTTSPLDLNTTCANSFLSYLASNDDATASSSLTNPMPNSTLVANLTIGDHQIADKDDEGMLHDSSTASSEMSIITLNPSRNNIRLNSATAEIVSDYIKSNWVGMNFNSFIDTLHTFNEKLCNKKIKLPEGYVYSDAANLRNLGVLVAVALISRLFKEKDVQIPDNQEMTIYADLHQKIVKLANKLINADSRWTKLTTCSKNQTAIQNANDALFNYLTQTIPTDQDVINKIGAAYNKSIILKTVKPQKNGGTDTKKLRAIINNRKAFNIIRRPSDFDKAFDAAAAGASAARALLAGRAGRLAATLTALRTVSSHRSCKAEAGNNGQHGAGFDQGIQGLHLVCLCCDGEGVFPLLQVIHRSSPNPPNFF